MASRFHNLNVLCDALNSTFSLETREVILSLCALRECAYFQFSLNSGCAMGGAAIFSYFLRLRAAARLEIAVLLLAGAVTFT